MKIGHLKEFLVPNQTPRSNSQGFEQPRNNRATLGMIEVIHVAKTQDPQKESKVMVVISQVGMGYSSRVDKRKRVEQEVVTGFTN